MQDAIADTAQDIAGLLLERRMEMHAGMAEPLMRLVARCIDACDWRSRSSRKLEDLLESGGRGRGAEPGAAMVVELGQHGERY
jgi:uncharacterized protein Yka (UPF0111/DUF47 family)